MRLLTIAAFAVAVVMSGLAAWQIVESWDTIPDVKRYSLTAKGQEEPVEVTVAAGMAPKEIGERLEEAHVIDSATQFSILVSLLGYDQMLQAGDYEFDAGTPTLDAVYRIRQGIVSTRSVTVVESWRLDEIADALASQGVSKEEFLAAARVRNLPFDFLQGLRASDSLEGYLFPATYPIRQRDKVEDIVSRMLQGFQEKVPQEVRQRAAASGLSLHDVVTLASIIEREAKVPTERPIMAQVFLSRLRQGIPLEADPTVQYAVASDPASVQQYGYWKQELTRADLETPSPYNTYRQQGLPPGPICNPGLASILAVVQPSNTDYLYFVAKPDGSHAFASTLEEHQRNIEKYRPQ